MDRLGSCQRIAPQVLLILVRLFVSSLNLALDSSFCYLMTSYDASPQVIRWRGIYLSHGRANTWIFAYMRLARLLQS